MTVMELHRNLAEQAQDDIEKKVEQVVTRRK